MRILGIDPGTRRCGYGVIEADGGKVVYVECGVIEPPARDPLERRLGDLMVEMGALLDEFSPTHVAVEDVFYGIDARAALTLGHGRGVILAQAGRAGLPVFPYPPATVKKTVAGNGAAEKESVARMVAKLLSLRVVPRADAADALAVAICHAFHLPAIRLGITRKKAPRARKATPSSPPKLR